MAMNISSAIVQTAQPPAPGQAPQARSAGAEAFRQELVQKVGSLAPGGAFAAAPPVQLLAAVPTGQSAEQRTDTDSLLAAISGLLAELQEPEGETDELADANDPRDLEAGLDQLNALLVLIGSVPVQPDEARNDTAGQAADSLGQAEQLKVRLQDALLQLQETVQQGPLKQVQHRNAADLIDDQLKSLAALLESAGQASTFIATGAVSHAGKAISAGSSQNAVPDASVTVDHRSALLQRLTNKTGNLSVLHAAAEQFADGKGVEAQTNSQPVDTSGQSADKSSQPVDTNVQPPDTSGLASAASAQSGSFRSEAFGISGSSAAAGHVNANRFAESMTSFIVQKFDISTVDGGMEARIQLKPEHLGKLDLSITVQNGQLTAIFHTDTAMAKDMLDNQMAQLRLALQSQGLNVDRLEVWQSGTAAQFSDGQTGKGNSRQQSPDRGRLSEVDGIDSDFEEEMAEQAAIQHLGYGRSINATA